MIPSRFLAATALFACITVATTLGAQVPDTPEVGHREQVAKRLEALAKPLPAASPRIGSMTPAQRRQAIDTIWGPGPSTAEKLAIFDTFWKYADEHFVAFQGITVDWAALRDKYRPEVAAGVSRGRFAGIINHMSLALRESHTQPADIEVNFLTLPAPGVPLLGVGAWIFDTVGACVTAMDDGSALVYGVNPNHPLGLRPGDRILGYDGKPWRTLYQSLIDEELPLWPVWWGSSPESFDRSFVMSAGTNWGLFDTMDILKQSTGQVVHMPTSLMPGPMIFGFCSDQLFIPGVPRPNYFANDYVSSGIVRGTNTGYIYVWGWNETSADQFAQAAYDLTQVQKVDGLIVDFRFNVGGFIHAPFLGLGVLFDHPSTTIAFDTRQSPTDHLKMRLQLGPKNFKIDFADGIHDRVKFSYSGPIALLVGPGAVSAGDLSSLWLSDYPNVRTFGKSTASAFNLPTQAFLGTHLDLGPDWFARVAEAGAFEVGAPNRMLTHTDFPVDESIWLTPDDVAVGKDTVVAAALRWIATQQH